MSNDRHSWTRRFTKRRVILAVIGGVIAFLAPTALKWALYERADAAPRLRSLVGTDVTLPQRTLHVMGRDVVMGPDSGKLTYVGYRLNDRWGWFDLEVHLDGGVHTGLSPGDVARVVAEDGPNQRRQLTGDARDGT